MAEQPIHLKVRFSFNRLYLAAGGHAAGRFTNAEVNTACAAFTALVTTFERSVTGLTGAERLELKEDKGLLEAAWQFDTRPGRQKAVASVLIRSFQIGCYELNKSYPGVLDGHFELDGLWEDVQDGS